MDRRGFLGTTAVIGAAGLPAVVAPAAASASPAAASAPADATRAAAPAGPEALPGRGDVLAAMRRVNDRWIGANADPGGGQWHRASYFSGNMAHYRLTGDRRYLDHTVAWAERNRYGLVGGAGTRTADHQCAGEVYLDLYDALGGASKIEAIGASLARMRSSTGRDDWTRVDALHMAMPSFARLGALRNDASYWTVMYQLYDHAKRRRPNRQSATTGLYDEAASLWYWDDNYAPGGAGRHSPAGRPVFWSRGNGWALAAHAKVLRALPAGERRVPEYAATLRAMAGALRAVQRPDGFWNSNLADPDHFGGPEASGTALFVYGIGYGINAGVLDRATYLPVVARAWHGLVTTAVGADGFLGYVQAPGAAPGPSDAGSTADYGVGAFLLAGAEVAALAG